jgi:hypothetical protein
LRDEIWEESEKLSDFDRADMDREFSKEEIKYVIDQMERNKAAGPDGFPIEFYQSCWEIVKDDLMALFNDFYLHKIDLARINYSTIILIPKSDEASTIQKARPICLLQVLFKIFTKVLTVRSEAVMSNLINECQNAFIRGRFIADGVSLLQEILRETKYKKQKVLF